ncbi:DUF1214 domain-containing protein [Novosphingobium aquae]|uniref:DUF1214 domain-containing protein n=1 Tax=Novosphingobium aquae TaxID=3133435 RepID=A0ABU8S620_9SPHN
MPIVSFDAMRDAYFRDAEARYNDLVYWSRPSDYLNQTTTPNSTSHYVYANVNLADGPVVFELPPSGGTALYGNLHSAWQVPVEDFGPAGIDKGLGGKFLLTPPGYVGPAPAGMRTIDMPTRNGYFLLRLTPRSSQPRSVAQANGLIKQLRLYSLADVSNPRAQRHIDMSGKLFDGIAAMDAGFYDRLARILGEEAPDRRDMVMRGMLASLGIEPGKPFAPATARRQALDRAAAQAKSEMIAMVLTRRAPWWPGSQWGTSAGLVDIGKAGFTYEQDGALRLDDRARTFFFAFAMPRHLGAATFYLTQTADSEGQALCGDETYTLHVPADVPAADFWAINVYDLETSGFLRGAASVGTDSNRRNLIRNKDGSVDIVFSAKAPAGPEGNWVTLMPGRRWTAMFRLYGPGPPLFDKRWRLPDIVKKPSMLRVAAQPEGRPL